MFSAQACFTQELFCKVEKDAAVVSTLGIYLPQQ